MKYTDDLPLLICNSLCTLEGQSHEIFASGFFYPFSQASQYNVRVISIFFENSRRYSQVKVSHNDTLSCEYLREFSKKIETTLKGLKETDSWKKNQSRKSRGTVPLCSRPSFLADAQYLVSLLLFTILYTGTEERRQSFRGLTTAPSHISYWLIYVCFPAANEKPDLAANKYRTYIFSVGRRCRVSFWKIKNYRGKWTS